MFSVYEEMFVLSRLVENMLPGGYVLDAKRVTACYSLERKLKNYDSTDSELDVLLSV